VIAERIGKATREADGPPLPRQPLRNLESTLPPEIRRLLWPYLEDTRPRPPHPPAPRSWCSGTCSDRANRSWSSSVSPTIPTWDQIRTWLQEAHHDRLGLGSW